jgi:hypothetical protein
MRTGTVVLIGMLALLFSGCLVMSLHPFFTDADSVFEKSLIGTWTDKSDNATLTFKQFGANAYRVTYLQHDLSPSQGGKKESGEPGEFEGHVGRVNGGLFLDLYPEKDSWDRLKNDALAVHLAPTHTISKVWFDGDMLMVAGLNHDWLKELVAKDAAAIGHETVEGAIVLTASTEALQGFLKKYADEPGAFPNADEFRRQK